MENLLRLNLKTDQVVKEDTIKYKSMIMFEFGRKIFLEDMTLSKNTKSFSLIWFEGNSFVAGVPESEVLDFDYSQYSRQFEVTITKGFWMGQHLITEAHWKSMGYSFQLKNYTNNINYPIIGINWLEAMDYCRSLNEKYKLNIPKGYHFSLPTEMHWEYVRKLDEEKEEIQNIIPVWNSPGVVNEVGQQKINSSGIFDMYGNASEWCFDIATSYPDERKIDWVGNQEDSELWFGRDGEMRIERGSFIRSDGRTCTKYDLRGIVKDEQFFPHKIGFRVCLRPITAYDLEDPILKKYQINMLS